MTPRTVKSLDSTGSARIDLITDPPWFPVAPKTVMTLDMVAAVVFDFEDRKEFKYARRFVCVVAGKPDQQH